MKTSMQPLSYCQHGCYSYIYTTYVHTFVFIVSLEKWSLTFEVIPGIPPRLVLILLVLVCRIQRNNHKVMVTHISSTSHQSYICRDIYAVHPNNCEDKYTTQCTKFDCRHFGLSTCWSVDVLACRCFGLSTFWFVNILVCQCFDLSMFQCVDVSVCRHFGCRRFGLFWPVTYKRVHSNTSKPGWLQKWSSCCRRHIQMDFFNDFFL